MLQRVHHASVRVEGQVVGEIQRGLLLLVGIAPRDTSAQVLWMAKKVAGLRIFPDTDGKMNLSVVDVAGAALSVSQFTLYGDCRKGRRPSFVGAGHPDLAKPLWEEFSALLVQQGVPTERGVFAADMQVELLNDGPVTLILEAPQ